MNSYQKNHDVQKQYIYINLQINWIFLIVLKSYLLSEMVSSNSKSMRFYATRIMCEEIWTLEAQINSLVPFLRKNPKSLGFRTAITKIQNSDLGFVTSDVKKKTLGIRIFIKIWTYSDILSYHIWFTISLFFKSDFRFVMSEEIPIFYFILKNLIIQIILNVKKCNFWEHSDNNAHNQLLWKVMVRWRLIISYSPMVVRVSVLQ